MQLQICYEIQFIANDSTVQELKKLVLLDVQLNDGTGEY